MPRRSSRPSSPRAGSRGARSGCGASQGERDPACSAAPQDCRRGPSRTCSSPSRPRGSGARAGCRPAPQAIPEMPWQDPADASGSRSIGRTGAAVLAAPAWGRRRGQVLGCCEEWRRGGQERQWKTAPRCRLTEEKPLRSADGKRVWTWHTSCIGQRFCALFATHVNTQSVAFPVTGSRELPQWFTGRFGAVSLPGID